MKEKDLRKWHRNLGIILAFFVMLQAITGLFITIGEINTPHSHAGMSHAATEAPGDRLQPSVFQTALSVVHHGGGSIGALYRIFLGTGLLWMSISGSLIYFKIRARNRASGP